MLINITKFTGNCRTSSCENGHRPLPLQTARTVCFCHQRFKVQFKLCRYKQDYGQSFYQNLWSAAVQ